MQSLACWAVPHACWTMQSIACGAVLYACCMHTGPCGLETSLNLTLVAVDAGTHSQGQLYNLDSKYGNQEQLIELNKAIREAGMTPVADIVINHRCADEQVRARVW